LLLPVVAMLWQTLGFGLGLTLATVNVFFRDVAHMIGVIFQIWMWSLPIVYVEDVLPAAYRSLLIFNPAYAFVRAVRDLYLSAQLPTPELWIGMLTWSLVAIALGFVTLRLHRAEIRDVL
jgi:ABC-type polysaccharide/polyol phosphate export permease